MRVALAADDSRFVELLVEAPADLALDADTLLGATPARPGDRLPVSTVARDWLAGVATTLPRGELWIVDYADETAGLLARGPDGPSGWLRTYRAHGRGTSPLDAPGEQDVTCDVALGAGSATPPPGPGSPWCERPPRPTGCAARDSTSGSRRDAGAGTPERTEATSTRSAGAARELEGAALTDPAGLGAHRVLCLRRG